MRMTWLRLIALSVLLLVGVACSGGDDAPVPIENSTYRIGIPEPDPASDVKLHIFRDRDACIGGNVDDEDACVPYVDRQKGETHLSFQIRDKTSEAPFPQPLDADQVKVFHEMRPMEDVQLIPHQKAGSAQLFVVLIDGSSSMFENDGEAIKKVYNALMRASVVGSFFPGDGSKTGVVLMRFMSGDPVGLDGGPPKILRNKAEYKKAVRDHLMMRTGGFTHLYNAARMRLPNCYVYPKLSSS